MHVSKILVGGGFAFGCRKNRRTDYFHDQRKIELLFPANDQNQCYLRIYNIVAVNALGGRLSGGVIKGQIHLKSREGYETWNTAYQCLQSN